MLKSPAWWSVVITLIIAVGSSMLTSARVESRTDARVVTLEQQVPAMEERLSNQMERHREETRDDIRDMRKEILEILKGK